MASEILSFYDVLRMPDAPLSVIGNSSGTAYKIAALISRHLSNPFLIDVEHSFAPGAFVPGESFVSAHIGRGSIYGCDYGYDCCNPSRFINIQS